MANRRWKLVAALVTTGLCLLLPVTEAAAQAWQSYDCQARIASPEPVPPPKAGETDTWQCLAPTAKKPSLGMQWVRDSLEYCRSTMTTYDQAARAALEASRKYGPKGWIVFMDADETVLDNSLYQKEREACGLEFSDTTWTKWVHAGAARAIPGAAHFTQTVHALGGLVAIVTNRDAADDKFTRKNLKADGLWFDYEIGLPAGTPSAKDGRWKEAVEQLGKDNHTTPKPVMWVGDQVTDLPVLDANGGIVRPMSEKDPGDGIGEHFFVIPNPVYGVWTKNPPN